MKTKKIFLSCIALFQICIALSQNPTTFPNSIRLPNAEESETITDSTKVAVIDNNGIVKYALKQDVEGEPFDIKEWGCEGSIDMFSTPNLYFEIGDYTFHDGNIWVKVAGSSNVFQVPMEFNDTKYVLHYDRYITESPWTAEDETVLIRKNEGYEFVIAEGIVSSNNYKPTLKICANNSNNCMTTIGCAIGCSPGGPAQLTLGSHTRIGPDQIFQEHFDNINWCGNDPIELPVREYQSHWKRLTTTKINNPLELNNQKLGEVFYYNNNLYKFTGNCAGGLVEERNYFQYDRVVNFTGLFGSFSSDITLEEEIYENEVVLLKESSGMGSLSGYILIKPSENYPADTYSMCDLLDDILYATSFPNFCPGQTTPIKYDEISGKYYTTANIDPEYIEYSEESINPNCAELIVKGAGEASLTITDNDQVEAENVNTINFIGATITDNEDGSVDVEYISGGSSVTIGTDGQIPFVNSDEDDFEYSGNLTYNGASLMNGSNVYMNHNGFQVLATGYNTDIGQYSIHQALNNPGTNPTISIENTGTGDAGIGFKAGSRGVTMGIDNSDGDLFKISVGSSIPNVGAGTVILEADNNQIKLPIYGSGTITGTATKLLAVDADGKVIEEDLPSGGSSLTVTDDDEISVSNVDTINFVGATVTDNEDGSVDVEYSSGGSSITIGTDGQIPFTNSSDDDFDYSSEFTYDGTLKITKNDSSADRNIAIVNSGTGDASLGLMAGNRGVTMGIDNSDSDLFKIAIGNGATPDLGAANNIIRAEFGALTLDLKPTGIGYYLSDNWYTAITNQGFNTQSSTTTYSRVISNQGFITQSSLGNQISLSPEGNIKSTVGTSTDITLQLNNGARGEFSLPDLGNATTKDTIVTQTTQTVKQAKVTISPLNFRSISSNPIELIPAQGAGTVVNVIGVTAFLDYNSAPFNFVGEVKLRVGNNSSWTMDSTDINAVADNYISFKAPTQSSSSVGNAPVVITSGSDSIGGDSDITIIVTYTVDEF